MALDHLLQPESLRRYQAALATLSVAERSAIAFRFEQELSYDDIAARLGLTSPGQARVVVSRAIRHLAYAMSGELPGASPVGPVRSWSLWRRALAWLHWPFRDPGRH